MFNNKSHDDFLNHDDQTPTFNFFLKNSLAFLSIIVLLSSFIVFFQFGRAETNRTTIKDGQKVKVGKFATPKKDDAGKELADQSCTPNKDSDCNPIVDHTWLGGYWQPENLFWDENYHIASAERYLQGKFFMEPHPGLGKMFIALGEKMLNPNWKIDKSKIVGDNKNDEIPYIKTTEVTFKESYKPEADETAKFNFSGVRFFPVLFAWLSSLVLFYLLYLLTKNEWIAFVFSMGYTFDNAIVVHSRGAMLDGIQLFFILSALTYFVHLWNNKLFKIQNYVGLGIWIGLAVATKVNGLILAPLLLILAGNEYFTYIQKSQNDSEEIEKADTLLLETTETQKNSKKSKKLPTAKDVSTKTHSPELNVSLENDEDTNPFTNVISVKLVTQLVLAFVVIGGIFGATYYAHFSIAKSVVEKNNFETYTSETTKKALAEGKTANLENFVPQLKDHLNFTDKFQKGVPKWDPTKGKDEAGSLPWTWPVGNHAIRYFVSKSGDCREPYPDSCRFSYLYLLPNMVSWLISFFGILLGLALIAAKFLFGLQIKDKTSFFYICLFSGLYVCYMAAMTQIDRVMYLYHYFLPLSFALINSAVVFHYIFENRSAQARKIALTTIGVLIFVYFVMYAPFSYRLDISSNDFDFKNWNKYWGLMKDWS
jgi:dolichyl-phosphate-mannose-protein mannosyltransferase